MKEFSFCESSLASSMSPWHIRALTDAGLKLHGGIDTSSLCGRVKSMSTGFGGWDLEVPLTSGLDGWLERGIVCLTCADMYKKERTLSAAELQEAMKDPLIKAIVDDRIQDVAEGRTSKWTKRRPGFEIKPKSQP